MATLEATYEIHPLAHLLPAMRDDEFAELKEDIAANGLRESIKLYEGRVLDGRHRYRACNELHLWPTFENYEGDEPARYVLSLNVKRRHLNEGQRAMLSLAFLPHLEAEAHARQLSGLRKGDEAPSAPTGADGEKTRRAVDDAADLTGASSRSVQRAKRVQEEAPEIAKEVRDGHLSLRAADDRVAQRTSHTRDNTRKHSAESLVENLVSKWAVIPMALREIDTVSAISSPGAPLVEWDRKLTAAIQALNSLRGDIRKEIN